MIIFPLLFGIKTEAGIFLVIFGKITDKEVAFLSLQKN
jgi:hypothetical protein